MKDKGYKLNRDSNFIVLNKKEQVKLRKTIINKGILANKDIISNFYGIREASKEEIDRYIEDNYSYKLFYTKINIFIIISFIVSVVLINISICSKNFSYVMKFLFIIIFMNIGLFLLYRRGKKEIEEIKEINIGKVYIAECFQYEKKLKWYGRGKNSRMDTTIRVWDKKNHYIRNWFRTYLGPFYNEDRYKLTLYVFKKGNKHKLGLLITWK